MPSFSSPAAPLPRLVVSWGLVVGLGTILLQFHATRPDNAGMPARDWPDGCDILLDGSRSTMLIFLHPQCPCSRASVAELASLLRTAGDRVSIHAFLFVPAHPPDGWHRSAIERDLADLPAVQIWPDVEDREARRFGVATSGHVLLYDTQGRLTYSGGITSARGHEGDNYGRAAVLARILGQEGDRSSHPVFGCPLAAPRKPISEEAPR